MRSGKLRFAATAVAWAAALYFAVWLVATSRTGLHLPYNAGYVPLMLALLLAARGASWERKARFALVALAVFVAADMLASATGVEKTAVSASIRMAAATPAQLAVRVVYEEFSLAYPFAVLLLFVRARPGVLWEPATRRPA